MFKYLFEVVFLHKKQHNILYRFSIFMNISKFYIADGAFLSTDQAYQSFIKPLYINKQALMKKCIKKDKFYLKTTHLIKLFML